VNSREIFALLACTAAVRRLRFVLGTTVLPLALAACPGTRPQAAAGASSLPPVIVISFDTARADAFGALSGETPSLTPRLDELAADSVVFENAFVQAPHTLISHMSLFTSVYPDVHGVKPEQDPLPAAITTLPQILDRAGYHTVGRTTSEWLKPEFGFGRGFDDYEVLPHRSTYAPRVNAAALDLVNAHDASDGPLFLFLHYYDLHSDFDNGAAANKLPYFSPEEYRRRLGLSGDGGEFCDDAGHCNTAYLLAADRERRRLPRSELDAIHDLYRSAVPYLDFHMGELLDELRRAGLYEEALIVVTSDHGEEFREHGRFIHSQPYDETTRVPLFVKLPHSSKAGTRIRRIAESVDVVPTILEVLDLPTPRHTQGESLLGLMRGSGERRKSAVASQDTVNLRRYALRTDALKVIVDLGVGRRELYDLVDDPGERHDLAAERPILAAELEERLKRLVRSNRALGAQLDTDMNGEDGGEGLLSDEERERLKALGYLN
jgi:arylsulfatase A-like enzyme